MKMKTTASSLRESRSVHRLVLNTLRIRFVDSLVVRTKTGCEDILLLRFVTYRKIIVQAELSIAVVAVLAPSAAWVLFRFFW